MDDYQNQEDYEQDERQELYTLIQAKKEKFRVKIRSTKNKQHMHAKRMRLVNGTDHTLGVLEKNNSNEMKEFKQCQDEQKLQKLQNSIQTMSQFQTYTKEEVIKALNEIYQYLEEGTYHQDIELLVQISSQLTSIINIDAKTQINTLDSDLVKYAALVILNTTYKCDDQQKKYFETEEVINSIMKLFFYEDQKTRELIK